VIPFLALMKITAFQKVIAYGMYIWGMMVGGLYTLASSNDLDAVFLGMIGAVAVSVMFALRRLVLLLIQIGEAAAEKKLRDFAVKTGLTEEEIHNIVATKIEDYKSELD